MNPRFNTDTDRRTALRALSILIAALVAAIALLSAGRGLAIGAEEPGSYRVESVRLDLRAPGRLEIIASDVDAVSVARDVRDPLGRATTDARVEGDTLVIESRCTPCWLPLDECRVDYTLRVPAATAVSSRTRNVRVEVEGLRAPLDLDTRNGRVDIANVEGTVEIRATNRDVELREVRGEVRIRNENGAVRLRDVTAPETIEVATSNGAIDLSNVEGSLELTNTNRTIDVDAARATIVEAETTNAPITMEFVEAPERIEAQTSNGDVDLVLPGGAPAYDIHAGAPNGRVNIEGVADDPEASFVIEVATSNADIDVRTRPGQQP